MTVLLDHLGAAVGAGGVALLLIVAGLTLRSDGVDASVGYADDRRFDAFTTSVERDLASAAQIDQDAVAAGAYGFDVHTDPATAATARVEYLEVAVPGGLRLDRYVDGALDGQSPVLASWDLRAVDAAGAPSPAADASGLALRLDALQGDPAHPDTVRWARVVRSPGLGGTSY